MNTKANRLTEIDVHTAMEAMFNEGDKPTALKLLRVLDRGSLTTITKFMNSFSSNQEEPEALPPALVEVPREIGATGDLLIKKIWADARTLANNEIESQRSALVKAEAEAKVRVNEAMEFSDVQAKQIEALENLLDELKSIITDKDKNIKELEADVKNLTQSLNQATKEKAVYDNECKNSKIIEERNKIEKEELKRMLDETQKSIKLFEKTNKSLELQIGRQQIALDQQANSLESLRNEVKNCKNECKEAGEYAARLSGKLEVYEKNAESSQTKKRPGQTKKPKPISEINTEEKTVE